MGGERGSAMPIDYSRYPKNWLTEIRPAILARAGNRCEWCGGANGAYGARDRFDEWHDESAIEGMNSTDGMYRFGMDWDWRMVRIVLTIAHLGTEHPDGTPGDKHDKLDCRPENLAALCQRCHLNYDRADHIAHARETRARKRGQLALTLEATA